MLLLHITIYMDNDDHMLMIKLSRAMHCLIAFRLRKPLESMFLITFRNCLYPHNDVFARDDYRQLVNALCTREYAPNEMGRTWS